MCVAGNILWKQKYKKKKGIECKKQKNRLKTTNMITVDKKIIGKHKEKLRNNHTVQCYGRKGKGGGEDGKREREKKT